MSEWGLRSEDWKDDNPIGQDATAFILENPEWLLYLRKDHRFYCPKHWDVKTKGPIALRPNEECKICYGFGIKIDPMLIPCRVTRSPIKASSKEGDIRLEPGYNEFFHWQIDTPREVKPNLEDIVGFCEFHTPTNRIGELPYIDVKSIQNTFLVKQINPNYERQLSWFSVSLEIFDLKQGLVKMITPMFKGIKVMNFDSLKKGNYW